MSFLSKIDVPSGALRGSMRDFRSPKGRDLTARCEGFYAW